MTKKLTNLFFIALLSFNLNAIADNEQVTKEAVVRTPNFYLLAGAGLGHIHDVEKVDWIGQILVESTGVERTTYLGGVGYQFHRYFGVEFNYLHFAKHEDSGTWWGESYKDQSSANSYALLGVAKLPFWNDRMAVFVKLGPSYNVINNTVEIAGVEKDYGRESLDFAAGGGLEFNFTHRFGFQAQFLQTGPDTYAWTGNLLLRI